MADLKATPQNEWAARIANALRGGRDVANQVRIPDIAKLIPGVGPLLANQKLGDLAFGRGPEGVEQMSYGEPPVTLPTLAKPMGFPKNEEGGYRAMDQLEGAGMIPTGSPAGAGKAVPLAAGMFMGKNSKTWNPRMAELFVEMLLDKPSGTNTAATRWKDTNTMVFPDGRLRQELSDDKMRMNFAPGDNPEPLGAAIWHPRLERAYPEFVDKTWAANEPGRGGMYSAGDTVEPNVIHIGNEADIGDPGNRRRIAGHEIMHGIQDEEGWAKGGNPEQFLDEIYNDLIAKYPNEANIPGGTDRLLRITKHLADQKYRQLAGEAEARLVEKRLDMTPEERRLRSPTLDWDVKDQQIIQGLEAPDDLQRMMMMARKLRVPK